MTKEKCRQITKHGSRLKGVYKECRKSAKRRFDKRSFRWKIIGGGKVAILIGCPRGKWNAKRKKCKVGTRAYKVLSKGKRA